MGSSEHAVYLCYRRAGGMGASELREVRVLEEEGV